MLVLASAFLAKLSHPVVLAVLMGAAVGGSMCTRARRYFRDPRRLDNNQLFLQLMAWKDDDARWQRHVGMNFGTYLIVLADLLKWESELKPCYDVLV